MILYQIARPTRSLRSIGWTRAGHLFRNSHEHDFAGRMSFGEAAEPRTDTLLRKARATWLHSPRHVTQSAEADVQPI